MQKKILIIFVALLATLIAGCGGGGSGGSGGNARVNLFATDDLSAGYDAVWVKIYKVDIRKSDSSLSNLFNDTTGKVIDLRSLNNGGNLYSFFGSKSISEGTYTGMRIEMDRAVTLFPTGSSTGQNRVFDDAYGADRARIDLTFGAPVTVSPGDNTLVADFDLSQWQDIGGEVRNAVIVKGTESGIENPGNHQHEDFEGTISGLAGTAPNFTFTLNLGSGNSFTVVTDANTAIFNNNAQPNPALANGKRVEARGAFDPVTGNMVASSVKIKAASDQDEFEAKGVVGAVNTPGRTFQVFVHEADGFIPSNTTINVVVNDDTRFFTDHGMLVTEALFFDTIFGSKGLEVEVEGSVYDSGTQTLTAKKCKLEDHEGENGSEVEARGAPSGLNEVAGTFNIALTSWEGFSASNGQIVGVATTGGTEYKNGDNQQVSKAEFFTLLATATTVKVEGDFEGGTITARECSLRNSSGGGGGGEDPHEGKGVPSNINAGARTFTLTLFEWFGFGGSVGLQINVQMTVSATYRSNTGESLTESQFFAMLDDGWVAEVEGTYSGGTFTATKAKLDDH